MVPSTPGVRGGASPANSAVPKSRELLYNRALSCRPPGLTIEKDLARPKARLTLVECFPAERRGCGASPE